MARRITGGLVGSSTLLGTIQISPEATISTAADQDITFSPGAGAQIVANADIQLNAQAYLRFADADSSNWVAFQAPATVGADVTWTLPATDGTVEQVLTTDGTGTLNFTDKSLPITNNTTDASSNFILFSSASSGDLTGPRTADTKITFIPNVGELTVDGTVKSLLQETIQISSYTLALTDRNRVVAMNNSAAVTVTVPPNSSVAFPIGSVVNITRTGAGLVTLVAGSGVSLTNSGQLGLSEEIILRKRGTNSWQVMEERKFARTASGGTINNQTVAIAHSYTGTGASSFVVS